MNIKEKYNYLLDQYFIWESFFDECKNNITDKKILELEECLNEFRQIIIELSNILEYFKSNNIEYSDSEVLEGFINV